MRRIQSLPEADRVLTPGEAAAELGIGVQALRYWAKTGKIRALRTAGGHRRYRAADVARLKRKREKAAKAKQAAGQ
jgi:excisionase family DNA binding protein